jgi:hypothetical protein
VSIPTSLTHATVSRIYNDRRQPLPRGIGLAPACPNYCTLACTTQGERVPVHNTKTHHLRLATCHRRPQEFNGIHQTPSAGTPNGLGIGKWVAVSLSLLSPCAPKSPAGNLTCISLMHLFGVAIEREEEGISAVVLPAKPMLVYPCKLLFVVVSPYRSLLNYTAVVQ